MYKQVSLKISAQNIFFFLDLILGLERRGSSFSCRFHSSLNGPTSDLFLSWAVMLHKKTSKFPRSSFSLLWQSLYLDSYRVFLANRTNIEIFSKKCPCLWKSYSTCLIPRTLQSTEVTGKWCTHIIMILSIISWFSIFWSVAENRTYLGVPFSWLTDEPLGKNGLFFMRGCL